MLDKQRPENGCFRGLRKWSQPGSNRRPPACKADQIVLPCLLVSWKCLEIMDSLVVMTGHERTAGVNLMHPWCTLASVTSGDVTREAADGCPGLGQLVDAAPSCTTALASAMAVCASSRGVSSNSSITWP
jgi:hypothetical protein